MLDFSIKAPGFVNILLESRVPVELLDYALYSRKLSRLPKGDGRAVLVIPGFATNDVFTIPLRRALSRVNYRTSTWDCGMNKGWSSEISEYLENKIERLYQETGRKVSIVGWSLGGVYARELARENVDRVHSVITLGSPISGNPKACTLYAINERFFESDFSFEEIGQFEKRITPPPVKSIAIYTKTDGVVSWQCSLEPEGVLTENIETKCSHLGLVCNPNAIKDVILTLQK